MLRACLNESGGVGSSMPLFLFRDPIIARTTYVLPNRNKSNSTTFSCMWYDRGITICARMWRSSEGCSQNGFNYCLTDNRCDASGEWVVGFEVFLASIFIYCTKAITHKYSGCVCRRWWELFAGNNEWYLTMPLLSLCSGQPIPQKYRDQMEINWNWKYFKPTLFLWIEC